MMQMIHVIHSEIERVLTASEGSNLLQLLREHGVSPISPCGGGGTCGKCKVRILIGTPDGPDEAERTLLGERAIAAGYRLACHVRIRGKLTVQVDREEKHQIITSAAIGHLEPDPALRKEFVQLLPPSLKDQRSDFCRLKEALPNLGFGNQISLLRGLPEIIRASGFGVTALIHQDRLIGLEPGDTTQSLYGVAFDLGTTTLAGYLVDLNSGIVLAETSFLNPQCQFGADVISRISHADSHPKGLDNLGKALEEGIHELSMRLSEMARVPLHEIVHVVFAGNTTMLHTLMGVSPNQIGAAPFAPTFTERLTLPASDLGLRFNHWAIATLLPGISGYVGADTVAAALAAALDTAKEPTLLVDLGTNGEIAVSGPSGMFACSAAAGPAFEGAGIRCGMGSMPGAIDSFRIDDGPIWTTIENADPKGICGSGLLDLVAELVRVGLIDETGRLLDCDELPETFAYLEPYRKEVEGSPAFVLEAGVFITQKDIRQIQSAKGAIAAGISLLLKSAGLDVPDIKSIVLAGGFGSCLDPASACRIGLLPPELADCTSAIGNGAGAGAIQALLSNERMERAMAISKNMQYVELSGNPHFNHLFAGAMLFPEL